MTKFTGYEAAINNSTQNADIDPSNSPEPS